MTNRLAIMDYGIGGIDLYKRIKLQFPSLGISYFSDAGEVPYGKLSKDDLYKRVRQVINFLKSTGVHTVIVACHSASSVAYLMEDEGIITMVDYTLGSVTDKQIKHIGVIGGGRTVRSGIYYQYLKSKGLRVSQRIAQPLSILVEKGETATPLVNATIAKILQPLKSAEALLLACTHYPVLKNQIQTFMGDNCQLIDPVKFMFEDLVPLLKSSGEGGMDIFFTTGNHLLMINVVKQVYNLDVSKVIKLSKDLNSIPQI